MRTALVDGVLMRWEDHGEPTEGSLPVVLVHGVPTSPRLWRYVVPGLVGSGVRCLAWEQVGFGWSMEAGLSRDISLPSQVGYLRAWLRHLGIERAVLVGHDLGGGVVQRLAVEHPELCAGLVLVDCVAYDAWPVAPVRAARRARGVVERLPAPLLRGFFDAALMYLGHDDDERRRASRALHWQPYAREVGPRAFSHQLESLDARHTMELAGRLRGLQVPARVLWAERDPLGVRTGERLAAELDAPLTILPGARHFTPEDHPREVLAEIQAILLESAPLPPETREPV